MLGENLFSTSSGMDTNHSDTNGPRGISNGHLKISIVSLKRLRRDQKSRNIVLVQIFVPNISQLFMNFQPSLKHVESITIPHIQTKGVKIWDD